MVKIVVRAGESVERALRRFNQKVYEAGIMDELKKRECYESPSEVKRRQKKEIERRLARVNR